MATRGNLNLEDKCYLAGFIDGEGCLGIYKKTTQSGNKGIYDKKIKRSFSSIPTLPRNN